MASDNNTEQRHKIRMEKRKAVVDASIASSTQDKGLVLVLTGNGKGKSSSAFGMVARALGHNLNVGVAQFVKNRRDTGEEAFFQQQANVIWKVLGDGFTWETQNRKQDIATAEQGWQQAQVMLKDDSINLVVLDELTYLLKDGYLDMDLVLSDISARPTMQHVVVTGRGAPTALCDIADTITELKDIKHAFRAGIQAQKGIDL